jgi:hypothetical protein
VGNEAGAANRPPDFNAATDAWRRPGAPADEAHNACLPELEPTGTAAQSGHGDQALGLVTERDEEWKPICDDSAVSLPNIASPQSSRLRIVRVQISSFGVGRQVPAW